MSIDTSKPVEIVATGEVGEVVSVGPDGIAVQVGPAVKVHARDEVRQAPGEHKGGTGPRLERK